MKDRSFSVYSVVGEWFLMIPPESRFLQEKKYNIEKQIEQKSSHILKLTKTTRSEWYRQNSQIRKLCQLQLIAVYRKVQFP